MEKERRRMKRLQPPEKMILIFNCNCNRSVIGRIHSISAQGLSVEYEEGTFQPKLSHQILIRIVDERQQPDLINEIRCTPVYDIPMLSHNQSFRGKKMRQLGMHYARMSLADRKKIDRLLASLAVH